MTHVTVPMDPHSGLLAGITVIGFNGVLDVGQTPARSEPVWVDAHGSMVWVHKASSSSARIEPVGTRISTTEPLPGDGTRVGPWPARLGWFVATIGPREIAVSRELRVEEPSQVDEFLLWLAMDEARSETLQCQRDGKLVHWYCSPADEDDLRRRIRQVAARKLVLDAITGGPTQLQRTSYWLARAAMSDEDVYRAAAGLRHACTSSVRIDSLLTSLVHPGTAAERAQSLAMSDQWLADAMRARRPEYVRSAAKSAGNSSDTAYRDRLRLREVSSRADAGEPSLQ